MAQHELISIPASHYCERARWALDYASLPFVEQKWPPILHRLGTSRAGGTRTVPVLKCLATPTQNARVLADSKDIVQYAHERMLEAASSGSAPLSPLYPSDPDQLREVERLEHLFASKLAVWTRVVAYHYTFKDRSGALDTLALRQTAPPAMEGWKRTLLTVTYPLVRTAITAAFRADAKGAAACLERIRGTFQEVGEVLQRSGGKYLVGDRFTAADLTFAALSAIVLMPQQYGAYLPPLEALPPDFPARELRDTPAGRHAMRMYDMHRRVDGWGRPTTAATGAAAPADADVDAAGQQPGPVGEAVLSGPSRL